MRIKKPNEIISLITKDFGFMTFVFIVTTVFLLLVMFSCYVKFVTPTWIQFRILSLIALIQFLVCWVDWSDDNGN